MFRHNKRLMGATLFLTAGLLACAPSGQSAIPAYVDGQAVPSLAPMLEQAMPAVVRISTAGREVVRSQLFDDPIFEHFFGTPRQRERERRTEGLGSGVIVDAARGYILTNAHVIDKAESITVTLSDGRTLEATQIGADADADVAVLKVDADRLVEIPLGNSDSLRVGDFVVAIGNPFGLKQTVTSGIVSALGRSGLGIESYENFIQTDASINPGNSGGGLVNLRGELVGINTAILGPNGGNIGIGFAIPINMANSIAEQIIEHGEVKRGRLGIGIQDLTPELARAFGLERTGGAVVSQVEEGSPAAAAGIQVGDVIVGVNGQSIASSGQLRNSIGLLRVDSKVDLEVIREGRRVQMTARVEAPHELAASGRVASGRLAGAEFGEVTTRGGRSQVVVASIEPGSPASRSGLQEGDVIVSVNRQAVSSVPELTEAVKQGERGILLNLVREGRGLFLLIQ
ncbi:MAG: Do family serine endopeptidase [Thiotrichales bacterium]